MTFINFFKDERMLQKTSKALYDGVKRPLEGPVMLPIFSGTNE
jgi:hypothetical protein